jgi:hypothetical protein
MGGISLFLFVECVADVVHVAGSVRCDLRCVTLSFTCNLLLNFLNGLP